MHYLASRSSKHKIVAVLITLVLLPFLYSGNDDLSVLQQAQRRGSITVLTRNGASSYFIGPDGATGPEYDLAAAFSDYLGLQLKVKVANTFSDLGSLLQKQQGDFIAANLTRTAYRERIYAFGPDYASAKMLVVYKRGQTRPRELSDLIGLNVWVIAGSSYEDVLIEAQKDLPQLRWKTQKDIGMEGLLLALVDGEPDVTLVDSNIFSIHSQFYPGLKTGFTLEDDQPQAWAFRQGNDASLLQESQAFFKLIEENGRLASIQNHYKLNRSELDRVGMFQFVKQVRKRLPILTPVFQDVANAHNLDWRFLAAMGYQESHWDPDAISQTGVRGIMMLTQRTANQMGVENRLDSGQSIEGGARYFLRMRNKIPDRIPEPDRSWIALAAYNIGWGHLEDARVLTEKLGGNPDRWADIEERLDLLSNEKWYRQTRYGYARGYEARQFVNNVKNYFDTLVWMETRAHPMLFTQIKEQKSDRALAVK